MKLVTLACVGVLSAATCFSADAAQDPLAPIGLASPTPPLPAEPITEMIFGTPVTDNYRFMEALTPKTLDWMKAEGEYTRTVMDAIQSMPALQARVAAFTGSFGFIKNYVSYNGVAFFEEREPGSDNFDLVVRDNVGQRKIVNIAALRIQHGGKPIAISYMLAAPDGSKVAAGLSESGTEAASLYVYDAKTGTQIAGPIDRAEFPATTWSADSKTLYFNRLKKLGPGDPESEKYRDIVLNAWTLGREPVKLFGATVGRGPEIDHGEAAALLIAPGASIAALDAENGVENEIKLWTMPADKVGDPKIPPTLLVDRSDGVINGAIRSDEVFLLSHKDAPTFKVLRVKAGAPLTTAETLVPADPKRILDEIHAAADALYVVAHDGGYSRLLRIATGSNRIDEVALPIQGHVTEAFTDTNRSGIDLRIENWVTSGTELHYDPDNGTFADLHLGAPGATRPQDVELSSFTAKAHDGVMVPVSLMQSVYANGPRTTVMEAYGSYGLWAFLTDFSPRKAAMAREGIAYAVCHVRGGGELGEVWRLAGKGANKHNTWEDLIACGEELIARGITTKSRLIIWGGSAGGIPMGRAMTERPDLFAGVIDVAPYANTLRAEFTGNGRVGIPEFGTITDKQGFRNLLAMDSIAHVQNGVTYPAVMICAGLNDPRVLPWHSAKFAAALRASGTVNPVLLRVDAEAGHGVGSTRNQDDLMIADWIAFAFWRSGTPGWQPLRNY